MLYPGRFSRAITAALQPTHRVVDEGLADERLWPVQSRSLEVVPEKIHEVCAAVNLKAPDGHPATTALSPVELVHFRVGIPPTAPKVLFIYAGQKPSQTDRGIPHHFQLKPQAYGSMCMSKAWRRMVPSTARRNEGLYSPHEKYHSDLTTMKRQHLQGLINEPSWSTHWA